MNLTTLPTGLTRNQSAAATPLALPAPTLPETTAYGGINRNHLTTGDRAVTLQAGPYDAFLPGDRLDVYWSGALSPIATAPVTREGIIAYVDIPGAAILQAGMGLKEYSFTLISSLGTTLASDPASVLVDLDAPGDPDPGIDPINPKLPAPAVVPMIIDAGVAEGGAEVTVPAWANMAINDVLSVYWGTVPVKVSNPAVGQAVVVSIDKTTILAAGDSPTLPVSYDIVDAVGNYSKRSPSTLVNVQASTTFFIAPKVLEAPTNVLDLDQLGSADVQVQVDPEQDGIALGDTVTLTWKGLTGEGIVVPPLTYTQTVDAVSYMIFPIPNAVAAALAQGSALLYYEANGRKSKDRQLSVIGQVQALAAPIVQEANGGVLDPADLTDVAHLQIDPYSVMSLGDTVTYYWTGKLAGSTASFLTGSIQVSGNDLNPPRPLVFTIPKAEIDALVGGTVDVYYTVDTYARALLNPSDSLVLSITGTVALPAPTVDYVVGGVLDPVNAPTGTNVRVATTYAGAAKGDIVRVMWNGKDAANSYSNSFAVTPGVEIVCAIPVQYIAGNESATVTATYQVERTGETTRYAEPLVFQIGSSGFAIDPSAVSLIANQTYTRQATGGTPPYTYSSSAPSVVAVPDLGRGDIRGVAPGSATITARDSASHQGNYPVTVARTLLIEDFERLPLGDVQPGTTLPTMTLTTPPGRSWIVAANAPPYLTGKALRFHSVDSGPLLEFHQAFSHVRFGAHILSGPGSWTIYAMGKNGNFIDSYHVTPGEIVSWIDLHDDNGTIQKISFATNLVPVLGYLDNFILTS